MEEGRKEARDRKRREGLQGQGKERKGWAEQGREINWREMARRQKKADEGLIARGPVRWQDAAFMTFWVAGLLARGPPYKWTKQAIFQ